MTDLFESNPTGMALSSAAAVHFIRV